MRLTDWRPRLRAEIAGAQGRRFRHGRHDCSTFAARCVAEITGSAEHFPGWHNATSAGAAIEAHGDLLGTARHVAALRGWAEIGATFAGAGDLVFQKNATRFGGSLGIVALDGRGAWFACSNLGGVTLVRLPDAHLAWRI